MRILPYGCGVEEEAVEVCRRLREKGFRVEADWIEGVLEEVEGLRLAVREGGATIAALDEHYRDEKRGLHEEIEWLEQESRLRYPGS